MISMYAEYSGRTLYVALSSDTIDGAKNGDKLYEMDTGKRYVYNETNDAWDEQPEEGGGDVEESHPYIQTFDYVQAENWTSDSLGNTKNFIDTYCKHGNGTYWFGINQHGQNKSDNYRAVRGFAIRHNNGSVPTTNSVAMLRAETQWSVICSTESSFHIKAGCAIKIWYIPLSTGLEGMTS